MALTFHLPTSLPRLIKIINLSPLLLIKHHAPPTLQTLPLRFTNKPTLSRPFLPFLSLKTPKMTPRPNTTKMLIFSKWEADFQELCTKFLQFLLFLTHLHTFRTQLIQLKDLKKCMILRLKNNRRTHFCWIVQSRLTLIWDIFRQIWVEKVITC